MSKYFYVMLILIVASCASVPKLSPEAMKGVYFLRPQKGKCKLIQKGLMVTRVFHKKSTKVIENSIMNRAVLSGANVVEVEALWGMNNEAKVNFYKCPDKYLKQTVIGKSKI